MRIDEVLQVPETNDHIESRVGVGEGFTLCEDQSCRGGLSLRFPQGHIRHLDYGLITLGEYRSDGQPAGITPRLKTQGTDLQFAGISVQQIEDLSLARWKKLIWNIPFNGLAVIKNSMTDALVKDPQTRRLCKKIMNEVACASAVCSRKIDRVFIEKMLLYTENMTPYAPSMKLDFDRGNPMEIESIYGNPLHAAKEKGVLMPETEKLYKQLLELNPAA